MIGDFIKLHNLLTTMTQREKATRIAAQIWSEFPTELTPKDRRGVILMRQAAAGTDVTLRTALALCLECCDALEKGKK